MKSWTEFSLYTEEQKVSLTPNETRDSLVLSVNESSEKKETRLYLSFSEAEDLIKLIETYISLNK